jgi:cytochrome c oxidase assembly factor CtaG
VEHEGGAAVTWWCSASRAPWSWDFRAYPGIWLLVALAGTAYLVASLRHHDDRPRTPAERRKPVWFALGLLLFWLSTDWPVGTLGAGYLASVHMLQYMLYTLAVAPLLLLGTPDWMVRPIVERMKLDEALRILAKPVVAGVTYNIVLIATHAPWTVDHLRVNQFGSMAMDLVWLLSGFVLWTPLISPLRELRHPSPAVRCVYLFLASGAIPMLPGGILTFSELPLYSTYELAPRVYGIDATSDQQTAGILMKVGSIPIVWSVIFVIFVKWAMHDQGTSVESPGDAAVVDAHAST